MWKLIAWKIFICLVLFGFGFSIKRTNEWTNKRKGLSDGSDFGLLPSLPACLPACCFSCGMVALFIGTHNFCCVGFVSDFSEALLICFCLQKAYLELQVSTSIKLIRPKRKVVSQSLKWKISSGNYI